MSPEELRQRIADLERDVRELQARRAGIPPRGGDALRQACAILATIGIERWLERVRASETAGTEPRLRAP